MPPGTQRLQGAPSKVARPIKVRVEYPLVQERLTRPGFQLVSDEEAATADVLFAMNPMRSFYSLPRYGTLLCGMHPFSWGDSQGAGTVD